MAIYKCGQEFETRDDRAQIQQVSRAGVKLGTAGLQVRLAGHTVSSFVYKSNEFDYPMCTNVGIYCMLDQNIFWPGLKADVMLINLKLVLVVS